MTREDVLAYFRSRDNNPEAQRGDQMFKEVCAANTKIWKLEAELQEAKDRIVELEAEADKQQLDLIRELVPACERAAQLAVVASDWGLLEVEIDGEMVSIYDLISEFRYASANKEDAKNDRH